MEKRRGEAEGEGAAGDAETSGRPKKEPAPGGGGRVQGGPVRTGRGTCLEGPFSDPGGGRRRFDAASPGSMCRRTAAGGTTALTDTGSIHRSASAEQSNKRPVPPHLGGSRFWLFAASRYTRSAVSR